MGGWHERWLAPLAIALIVLLLGSSARAAEPPASSDATDATDATDAVESDAPPSVAPDRAHGMRKRPRPDAKTVFIWIPRAVFFIPRYTLDIFVAQPVRLSMMAWDKYALRSRIVNTFFNEDQTFGVYPLAFVETGFGLNAGARLFHRDLGGRGETIRARASFGGLYRQRYEVSLDSGSRLGDRFKLSTQVAYRIVPRARFYGIGNEDEVSLPADAPRIDATDGAVKTRYRRDELLTRVDARIDLGGPARLLLSEELAWRRFARAQGTSSPSLQDAYDPSTVTGFTRGQLRAYSEAALVVDTTDSTRMAVPFVTPRRGWLMRTGGGVGIGFMGDPSRYTRGNADVQRFIDLRRSRVLRLRGYVDVVDAPLSRVTFIDLPTLGGPTLLRGYVRERYRGRIAALGSAEYTWPIDRFVAAFVFTDVGRVWTRLPLHLTAPRIGFGGGLLLVSMRRFLARIQVSASIDGDVYFHLRFDPSWAIDDDI